MPTIAKTRMRVVTRSRSARIVSLGADALTMMIGLGVCMNVTLIGTIPGAEIILITLLPILLIVRFKRITHGKLKYLFLLLGLWLVGQILTDLYRGTAFVNWTRGDSAIVFFALDLAGLAALVSGNERRKAIFILGISLGSLLATRISPSYFFADSPWKFGYGPGITSLVTLISCWFFSRRRYAIVAMLLLGIAGVNLFFDFRSPVLFLLVTLGVTVPVIPERIGRLRVLPPQGTGLRIVVLILIVLTTGSIAKLAVTGLAASGVLGVEARQKNELQANSTLGLLLGARPEIFVSSRAVLDSPILGHGAYAQDIKYMEMYNDLRVETGIDANDTLYGKTEEDIGLIPAHSHLMAAWVYAGVLGGVFWGYVLVQLTRGIVRVTVLRPLLLPSYSFLLISFAWDVLFSPFGYTSRIGEAFLLVVLSDLLNSDPAPGWSFDSGVRRRRFFARRVRFKTWSPLLNP